VAYRRRRRRFSRAVPNRWTSQLADGQAVGTAAIYQDFLVARNDYASNTNLEPGTGIVFAGIRGYITIVPTVLTAFSLWMSIIRIDQDSFNSVPTGPSDPTAFQNAIDERYLWWCGLRFPAATAANPVAPVVMPIHVRSKCRLIDDHIMLNALITNSVAGTNCTLTYNFRSNIRGYAAT